jgi:hypothetical protein
MSRAGGSCARERRIRGRDGFDGRTNIGSVLGQHDVPALARDALVMLVNFVAADRAQPREQSRLAAVRGQLANGFRERHLNDLLRRIGVVANPRPSEPVKPRKIAVKERVEGVTVVSQQALY